MQDIFFIMALSSAFVVDQDILLLDKSSMLEIYSKCVTAGVVIFGYFVEVQKHTAPYSIRSIPYQIDVITRTYKTLLTQITIHQ